MYGINRYVNQLRIDDRSIRSNVNCVKPYHESYSQRILEEQKTLQYRMMREEEISNAINGDGGDIITPKIADDVYVDPLPNVPNDDAWIRINRWFSGGYGVGGNSERVLRPNHPQFQLPEEITVNGRLAYYTEIGGEKIIYNDTLNRWELLAMWYGNGDPNNPLLGVGTGSNIPYPFYATWTTYIDPVFNASIGSIEKVAVGTTKAPDPGPPYILPSYLLFEDGSIATAENNDNIEVNII
jgi:hypothetical protein